MKRLFLILLTFGLTATSFAQPPNYDDLLIYFADGDYEKLVKKAEKYTLEDDTKNDPLPYLYCSKGNFEMSKDQKYAEDYPKAYNDAIKFAGKSLRKDKNGDMFSEHKNYFTDLKKAVVEDLKNMVDEEDFNRMRGTIMKLQRVDPSDVGSHFLMTAALFRIKDKSGAKLALKEALAQLDAVESVENWREVDFEMLRIGIIEYSKYRIDLRQDQFAKDVLNKVKQWFEEDEEFMRFYDQYGL